MLSLLGWLHGANSKKTLTGNAQTVVHVCVSNKNIHRSRLGLNLACKWYMSRILIDWLFWKFYVLLCCLNSSQGVRDHCHCDYVAFSFARSISGLFVGNLAGSPGRIILVRQENKSSWELFWWWQNQFKERQWKTCLTHWSDGDKMALTASSTSKNVITNRSLWRRNETFCMPWLALNSINLGFICLSKFKHSGWIKYRYLSGSLGVAVQWPL